jgi:hypothetical protein
VVVIHTLQKILCHVQGKAAVHWIFARQLKKHRFLHFLSIGFYGGRAQAVKLHGATRLLSNVLNVRTLITNDLLHDRKVGVQRVCLHHDLATPHGARRPI